MSYMDNQDQWVKPWDPPPAQNRRSAALWTSLDKAPSLAEAKELVRRGIRFADFDLSTGSSPEVVRTLKQAGIYVFAYNIGNGGGGPWGEPIGLAVGQKGVTRIREATRKALQAGADGIHLDNPDKLGEAQIERLMDAQVAVAKEMGRTPALHLKNAAKEYANILSRRPDLRAHTKIAVVEHLMSNVSDGKRLAAMGIPVYGIEFRASHVGSPTPSLAATKAFFNNNSWVSGMISMKHERNYEGRTGESMMREGASPMSQDMWTRPNAQTGRPQMRPANDPYAGQPVPHSERGPNMGNNRSRGRTPTPPPVPPDYDPAYDPRMAGGHVMDPRMAGMPPHMAGMRRAEKDGSLPPLDTGMLDPRYAAIMAHARARSAEKDGSMVPPDGMPPAGQEGGHPLLGAMAHLGAMSGRGHQPTAELQGFARFGDFMKDVMGVPAAGAPGFRPYAPLSPQELGVISQIIGVNAVRGADGQYGEDVRARVGQMAEQARAFQTQAGLKPDGVIGAKTGPAMMNTTVMDMVLAGGRAPVAAPTPGPATSVQNNDDLPPGHQIIKTSSTRAAPTAVAQENNDDLPPGHKIIKPASASPRT